MDSSGNINFVERVDQVPSEYRDQVIKPTPTPDFNNKKVAKAYRDFQKEKKRQEEQKKKEEIRKIKELQRLEKQREREQKKREKEEAKRLKELEKNRGKARKDYNSKSKVIEPVKP